MSRLSAADINRLDRFVSDPAPRVNDQRKRWRYRITAPITVVPLAEDLQVTGSAVPAYTIDISLGGLSLLHKSPVDTSLIAVDFAPCGWPNVAVILESTRCSRLGQAYTVSGRLLCRVEA
jgi:hypothetical protein